MTCYSGHRRFREDRKGGAISPMPRLRFTIGNDTGQVIRVPAEGLVLGRGPDADVQVNDPQVSNRHAQIRMDDDAWWVHDLDSSNGTQVNGRTIRAIRLGDGDEIALGDTSLVFERDQRHQGHKPVSTHEAAATPTEQRPAAGIEPSLADDLLVQKARGFRDVIREEMTKVVVGRGDVVDLLFMCAIAGGHAILVAPPGMAKCTIPRSLAASLGLRFSRYQLTPDTSPTDVIGAGERGPIDCNMFLAEDIDRAPQKTQAAILDVARERHVAAGSRVRHVTPPFMLVATQDAIEQEPANLLTQGQLDRFMFSICMDYPAERAETEIVARATSGPAPPVTKVLNSEDITRLQDAVQRIPMDRQVCEYVVRIVRATRPEAAMAPEITASCVAVGAGPRAAEHLAVAAKARAALMGRARSNCEDVQEVAVPVLRHRILTTDAADEKGVTPEDVVEKLLDRVPEPDEDTEGET